MPIILLLLIFPSFANAAPFDIGEVVRRDRTGRLPEYRQITVKVEKRNDWRKRRYAKIMADIQEERRKKESEWALWKLGNILDKMKPFLISVDSDLNPTLVLNPKYMQFRAKG